MRGTIRGGSPLLREKIAIIIAAIVLGGALGAGLVFFASRGNQEPQQVNGHPINYWVRCLDSDDPKLRARAVDALPQFGEAAIPPAAAALEDLHAQAAAADVLAILGKPAVPVLIENLNSPSRNRKIGALHALDRIGAPAAAPAVLPAAKLVDDEELGPLATQFIIHTGPTPESLAFLVGLLERASPSRKIDVIKILSRSTSAEPRVQTALLRAVRENDPQVHQAAMQALCNMISPPAQLIPDLINGLDNAALLPVARAGLTRIGVPAIDPMRRAAGHPSVKVRIGLAQILGQLAYKEHDAAEALVDFLNDPNELVSDAAASGLAPLWHHDPAFAKSLLSSPRPQVRVWAARSLRKVRPPPVDDLVPMLDDADENVRNAAVDVLADLRIADDPSLLDAVRWPRVEQRVAALRLLPLMHSSEKYNAMLTAMNDGEVEVRLAAVRALGQSLRSARAVDRLVEAVKKDSSPAVRALAAKMLAPARTTADVHDALLRASVDDDPTVASAAIEALQGPMTTRPAH